MDDSALGETIQSFAQWPVLGIVLFMMLRFWRRSDDNFVGIIAELRKSLQEEKEARLKDRENYEEQSEVLNKRIAHLELLLYNKYFPPPEERGGPFFPKKPDGG